MNSGGGQGRSGAGGLRSHKLPRSAARCAQGTEGHAGCRAATQGQTDLKHRHVSTAETPPPWDGLRGIQRAEMPQTHSSQRNCDYRSCGGERGRRADDARRSASRSVMARARRSFRGRRRREPPGSPAPRLPRDRHRGASLGCWHRSARSDGHHRHLLLPGPPTLHTQFIQQL